MGQGDYSITEFAHRLAQAEAKYGKEMLEIIECFTNSRVDLPVKKLEDLSRARMKCARHLRKMDFKKEEYINLWKLCNIYSATAVDVDDAMRDIRNALRKRLKTKDSSKDVSAFRRLIDEYRPTKKTSAATANAADHQQEVYDKPTSKEKQRWLELNVFGRKKEEKKDTSHDEHVRKSKTTPKSTRSVRITPLKITPPTNDLQSQLPPPPSSLPVDLNYDYTPGVYDTPIVPSPIRFHRPPPPSYPPPAAVPLIKPPELPQAPVLISEEKFDEIWSAPSYVGENPISTEWISKEVNEALPPESVTPAVFEVSEFLKNVVQPMESVTVNGMEENKALNAELEPPSSPQISPRTMYKPVAPPRPSAPSSKALSTIVKKRKNSESPSSSSEISPRNHVSSMQSHTRIEILPNSDDLYNRVQTADYENLSQCMTLDRRGILAKRHSIKIDTNSIKDFDTQRLDGSYLLSVPGRDFSIVVNHL